jgi:transposase InsO family protein
MTLSFGPYFEGRIKRLVKEQILHHLDFTDLEQCRDCIMGKFVKRIKKNAKHSTRVLEIIHTYICVPFPVRTVDEFNLFITFIHDYSRYGYIYPISERLEALYKFKLFKDEVENQHDLKIKVVRSDRGGYYGCHTEYGQVPGPFAKFLRENGIVSQYSTPGEPQQNEVVERLNKTLMDMVRSMLSYSNLPLGLWMEALKLLCMYSTESLVNQSLKLHMSCGLAESPCSTTSTHGVVQQKLEYLILDRES